MLPNLDSKVESGQPKRLQLTAEMVAEDVAWLEMWEQETGLKATGELPKDRLISWRQGVRFPLCSLLVALSIFFL